MLTNKKGLEGKNIINPDFEINELITPLAFYHFSNIKLPNNRGYS